MARGSTDGSEAGVASPSMTILEAADLMERLHDTKLLVEERGLPIGFLTEADIVRHVLAPGTRPQDVTVWDVLKQGWEEPPGDDGFDLSPLAVPQIAQGVCEECGALSVGLGEHDGLLLCPDCFDPAARSEPPALHSLI